MYDGAIGVKTGFTDNARRCLVSAATRDGVTLIAVTLNAPDDWNDHIKMLNYGFKLTERLYTEDF
jgi:D-alanyl-D-alanine carboxypeptidase/D-alanyl-D-alanine carboxypeptidase (penicillin-binding protein 5/6)